MKNEHFFEKRCNLSPTHIGDWCHVAAEQRDIMFNLKNIWEKVYSTQAQYAANEGKLAIAVKKVDKYDKGEIKKMDTLR